MPTPHPLLWIWVYTLDPSVYSVNLPTTLARTSERGRMIENSGETTHNKGNRTETPMQEKASQTTAVGVSAHPTPGKHYLCHCNWSQSKMQPQFPSVSLHLEQKGSQSPGPVHCLRSYPLPGGSSPSYSRYPEKKTGTQPPLTQPWGN